MRTITLLSRRRHTPQETFAQVRVKEAMAHAVLTLPWGAKMEGTSPTGRSWVQRLVRNPVAIIGALGSLFVVLANANAAIDGAQSLWRRWTTSPTDIVTTWQGEWKSRQGFHFGFAMELRAAPDGTADGEISWQLLAAPVGNPLETRIGATGIEYVKGHFDRAAGIATIDGYRVSDPTLLGMDSYRFQIKSDKSSFIGMTKNYGRWEAQTFGTVIVTEMQGLSTASH